MAVGDDEILRALDQQLASLFGEILQKNSDLRKKLGEALAVELAATPLGLKLGEIANFTTILDTIRDQQQSLAGLPARIEAIGDAMQTQADTASMAKSTDVTALLTELRNGFATQERNFENIAKFIVDALNQAATAGDAGGADMVGKAPQKLIEPVIAATESAATATTREPPTDVPPQGENEVSDRAEDEQHPPSFGDRWRAIGGWRILAIVNGAALLASLAFIALAPPRSSPPPIVSEAAKRAAPLSNGAAIPAADAQRAAAWRRLAGKISDPKTDAGLRGALTHACGTTSTTCPDFDKAMQSPALIEADRKRILVAIVDMLNQDKCAASSLPPAPGGASAGSPNAAATQMSADSQAYLKAARCLLGEVGNSG